MNLQNKKVKIVLGILIAVCLIVSYRIYNNIQNDKARAEKMSRVKTVAVTTGHASRQTLIPTMTFSGSLDPEWQAEVAAKVDGRLEKVYVKEGDRVIVRENNTAAATSSMNPPRPGGRRR